jgi:hypothetical protein
MEADVVDDFDADRVLHKSSGAERLLLLGHLLSALAMAIAAAAHAMRLAERGELSSLKINSPETGTVPSTPSRNQNRNYFEL